MAQELDLGPETLKDIIADLLKPGRDFRDSFDAPVLRQDVLDIKDLVVGQKLEGVVRNVVDFGAFVDIGIHEDGLIHISHMSRKFIKHPSQVVSVGDLVTVWVKKIDTEREKLICRSSLQMKLTDYVKQVSLEDFGRAFIHHVQWNRRLRSTGGRFFPKMGIWILIPRFIRNWVWRFLGKLSDMNSVIITFISKGRAINTRIGILRNC